MTALGPLVEDALAAAASAGALPVKLPAGFAAAVGGRSGRPTRLTARFFQVPARGDFRTVTVRGSNVEIVNLFFFPGGKVALPVFAMEYVIIGRKPVVGVVDIAVLCEGAGDPVAARDILAVAKAKRPHLSYSEDMPAWYRECRSGHDFFVRPSDLGELQEMLDVCHEVFSGYLERIVAPARPVAAAVREEFARSLRTYKDHHRDNSPGLPFLNTSFGEEWTGRFLREHLFA